ncbi:MAG: DUF4335 domain-containing protein [Cyanobacteria bacterium P01_G01_bin.54]
MTIKRQYSLPKCSLQLEGMSAASTEDNEIGSNRPLLSVLLQAECIFPDLEPRLRGGRDFLESLVNGVSRYAQGVLSGLSNPTAQRESGVQLWPSDRPGYHCLVWSPPEEQPVELELSTLHLADLVDAIDQFFADPRTLPDMTLQLTPVSRRYRQADTPLAVRAQPLLTGLGSLAVASLLLFFIPVPEVEEPSVPPTETTEERDETAQADPEGTSDETEPEGSPPETEDEPETDEPQTDEPEVDAAPETAPPERADSGETITAAELETLLSQGETITNPTEVRYIQQYLYRELNWAWQERDRLPADLAYRVTTTIDGAIVAYEPVAGTPENRDDLTPLPELEFLPTQAAIAQREATVDFNVVFTQNQVLQVNPWHGYAGQPTLGERIEDAETLGQLQDELGETLGEDWNEEIDTLGNELVFRVGVTAAGAIADYQAQNNAAFTLSGLTPLPDRLDPNAGRQPGSVIPDEPLGQFQVVFKPDGIVEVSPF